MQDTDSSTFDATRPLAGMRVLEMGSSVAGPHAGWVLSELGAEVLKLEDPLTGDATRTWGEKVANGNSAIFETNESDKHNFHRNLFLAEKFAKYNDAKIWHCFAQDDPNELVDFSTNIWTKTNLKNCYPRWSKIKSHQKDRELISEVDKAKDGLHYGPKHHATFTEDFLTMFGNNIR